MARPDILLAAPMHQSTMDALSAAFPVHCLWEQADQAAFFRRVGRAIQGVAVSGSFGRLDASILDQLPALEIIASLGVGYDNIDVRAAVDRDVAITNSPGACESEVADFAIGLLLATIRQIPQADRFLRAGAWAGGDRFAPTTTLLGRKVGIVGLGHIGQAVARRLAGFDVEIAYHGRNRQPVFSYPYHANLVDLAMACDVLIVTVSGGPQTRRLIDASILSALGPDGVLVNVSRGSVVDEAALTEALGRGAILAAGLDVFSEEPRVSAELVALPNTVLTPHVGSASEYTRQSMGRELVDNLNAWFAGNEPPSLIPAAAHLRRRIPTQSSAPLSTEGAGSQQ